MAADPERSATPEPDEPAPGDAPEAPNGDEAAGPNPPNDLASAAGPAPASVPAPAEDDPERETAYGLLQRGQALLKSRHHAQAAIVLQRAARLEPGKGSILEPLGRAYHHSGQFELARQTFEQLLDVDPSAHWAHFALAASLRKLDRIPEARTHLRLAVALSPTSDLYRQALAKVERLASRSDAA
jgi:Flp pilus assembly protein TadD